MFYFNHIEIIRKIISSFVISEKEKENIMIPKRKWRKNIEEVIKEYLVFFSSEKVEEILLPTFVLLSENESDFFLWEELTEEKVVYYFYKELLDKIFYKFSNEEYLKIMNIQDYSINKNDFCEFLEKFLLLNDEQIETFCEFKKTDFLNCNNEIEILNDFLPLIKDTVVELLKSKKFFCDEVIIEEWEFFDEFIDSFRRKNKIFTKIIPVFSECNLFMKNVVGSGTQRILQIYLENNNTNELRYEISAIYVALKLREILKKEFLDYPFITNKEFFEKIINI